MKEEKESSEQNVDFLKNIILFSICSPLYKSLKYLKGDKSVRVLDSCFDKILKDNAVLQSNAINGNLEWKHSA